MSEASASPICSLKAPPSPDSASARASSTRCFSFSSCARSIHGSLAPSCMNWVIAMLCNTLGSAHRRGGAERHTSEHTQRHTRCHACPACPLVMHAPISNSWSPQCNTSVYAWACGFRSSGSVPADFHFTEVPVVLLCSSAEFTLLALQLQLLQLLQGSHKFTVSKG